jgi:phospholipase D
MNTENAVYFSGKDDIYGLFKKIINSSENYIWIQAYYFTDIRIADFLLSAGKRGVAVTVLADKKGALSKYSVVPYLIMNKVTVYCDYKPEKAHDKVLIFDDEGVITGSYNFTVSASKYNAENALLIKDAGIVRKYKENFIKRRSSTFEFILIPENYTIKDNQINVITSRGVKSAYI